MLLNTDLVCFGLLLSHEYVVYKIINLILKSMNLNQSIFQFLRSFPRPFFQYLARNLALFLNNGCKFMYLQYYCIHSTHI